MVVEFWRVVCAGRVAEGMQQRCGHGYHVCG